VPLRIHFTAADLRKVRIAAGPHPLWEVVLSINSLQQGDELAPRFWGWRDSVGDRGRGHPRDARVLRAACNFVPLKGNFADFLTPTVEELDAQAHFDSMLGLSANAVRADLTRTYRRLPQPPRWAHRLHQVGRLDGVVQVLQAYRSVALDETIWTDVQLQVEAARTRYASNLLAAGLDGLLSRLHPAIHWKWPILQSGYGVDLDLHLDGRGLMIVPSYFNVDLPITLIDGEQPPTLVVPAVVDPNAAPIGMDGEALDGLGHLLGHTRAQVLVALSIAASTNQLAHRLHVTPAAISQHTKVLRAAGLVTTTRTGQSVRHALTPLGRALLGCPH
jgi:DNA-binding transcriptional ArsR family regulator